VTNNITKPITDLIFKYLSLHYNEITHIVKHRQFIKKSIDCKDQILFLVSSERNYSYTPCKDIVISVNSWVYV